MSLEKKSRNKKIRAYHRKGLGYRSIAKIYSLHWTTIKEIIKGSAA